ncbi:MAG TPA: DegQ family serine endoprotease [Candidatus Polarisedimenticolia bacterium]|nr:DegQ family serine endoprotease [Candidatus Polarisedimenticolia bacterium]
MKGSDIHLPRWVATVAILAALVCGGVLAIGLRDWTGQRVFGAPQVAVTVARSEAPVALGTFSNGFASVLKSALPAVVNIHTSKIVKPRQYQMPFFSDPFFRQFFGDQFGQMQPRPQREQSLGSGVIVASDGTILTNNHVIDGATDIKVQLSDKREFKAKVIGSDPKTDVAVLKIEATGLPTLALGDSSKLRVGDLVLAIGDPFGVGETATMGIISATGRSGLNIESYEDFIQTDAAINPGNSGGAMIDLRGNLVGINTAILSGGTGGNQGIGFAIPINLAHSVMDQIVTHGKVVRGYLGVYIQDVTPQIAKQFGLSQNNGVLIGDVSPNTPGSRAGLKRGDVVLDLNGKPVKDANELRLQVSQTAPGTLVKLRVWRDGKAQDVSVTLGELPEKSAAEGGGGESGGGALQGVQVQALTPDIAQQLNVSPGTRGVVVSSVDPSSAAAAAGVERGDIIQEVNHKPVTNVSEYNQALSGAGNQPVMLLINENGVTRYVVVETQ